MSSIRLPDLDWTCVQQWIDAIQAAQAQTAGEQGRDLVTAETMEWRAALQVAAAAQQRRSTPTADLGVAAGEAKWLEEAAEPWVTGGESRLSTPTGDRGVATRQEEAPQVVAGDRRRESPSAAVKGAGVVAAAAAHGKARRAEALDRPDAAGARRCEAFAGGGATTFTAGRGGEAPDGLLVGGERDGDGGRRLE
ncbi:unnamed protein product [Linum trigynum]|uniref:Uncharacterized protein n=1 Tax=Linum trigynum TaxID=586398 RepID=A0AAV2DBH1_9ROSI